MAKTTKDDSIKNQKNRRRWNKMGDAVYGLGLIGALFFYIQHATSFGDGVVGVLKAFVWPAFLVFKLLGFLKM